MSHRRTPHTVHWLADNAPDRAPPLDGALVPVSLLTRPTSRPLWHAYDDWIADGTPAASMNSYHPSQGAIDAVHRKLAELSVSCTADHVRQALMQARGNVAGAVSLLFGWGRVKALPSPPAASGDTSAARLSQPSSTGGGRADAQAPGDSTVRLALQCGSVAADAVLCRAPLCPPPTPLAPMPCLTHSYSCRHLLRPRRAPRRATPRCAPPPGPLRHACLPPPLALVLLP